MSILRICGLIGVATILAYGAAAGLDSTDSTVSRLTKRSACSTGPGWAPVELIGNSDTSNEQCVTQWGGDYTPIQGMEVWRDGANDDIIAGIRFTFGSGQTTQIYGHEDTSSYPSSSLTLAPGETITSAILYGDGDGLWLGHIYLETSKGQIFNAGRDTDGVTPYGIKTGGGLLLGALVNPMDDGDTQSIGTLGWLFMEAEIDHISIGDIKFNQNPAGTSAGIDPQSLVIGQWFNNEDNAVSYVLSPAYAVTDSFSYSQTVTQSFGAAYQIEISGEVFGLGVKEDLSFTWSQSVEDASTTAQSSATSVTCAASGTLKPSSGVKVTAAYQTGQGTWEYESTVTVFLKGGGQYQYNENGQLTDTAYRECTTNWENWDGGEGNSGSGSVSPITSATHTSSSPSTQNTKLSLTSKPTSTLTQSTISRPITTSKFRSTSKATIKQKSSSKPVTTSESSTAPAFSTKPSLVSNQTETQTEGPHTTSDSAKKTTQNSASETEHTSFAATASETSQTQSKSSSSGTNRASHTGAGSVTSNTQFQGNTSGTHHTSPSTVLESSHLSKLSSVSGRHHTSKFDSFTTGNVATTTSTAQTGTTQSDKFRTVSPSKSGTTFMASSTAPSCSTIVVCPSSGPSFATMPTKNSLSESKSGSKSETTSTSTLIVKPNLP